MIAKEKEKLCQEALQEYLNSGKSLRQISLNYKGITRDFLGGYFLGKGIDIYSRKSHINDHVFDKIDTEEKAYWLGFLYADGNVHKSSKSWKIELTLKEGDLSHLKKFCTFVDFREVPKYREKTKAYRVSFGSRIMAEQLIKYGCTERKSLTLKFPSEDVIPETLTRHFIRGYFDGDGCITLRHNINKDIPVASLLGTKEFLSVLLEKINNNGIDILKKDKNNDSNTYYVRFKTKEGFCFMSYMYKDATIYLERKYNKYLLMD